MASFMQLTKRLNSNCIGIVNGSDFKHSSMPYAYLGRAEEGKLFGIIQKYSFNQLVIYGEKIDDYVFSHEDIAECKLIGTNVAFTMFGKQKIGTKYEISFKNGKKAILTVVANSAQIVENVLL